MPPRLMRHLTVTVSDVSSMGSIVSLGGTAFKRVVTDLSGVSGFFIIMGIVFLLHSQINMEYRCSCLNKAGNLWYCWSIMVLPALLFLLLILGVNKRFQRSLSFTCRNCCRKNSRFKCPLLGTLMSLLNRASFAALAWVVVLLVHGDWYLCCSYSLPKEQSHLPCKDSDQLSVEERDVVFQLKNTSTIIGLMLLTSMVFLLFIMGALIQCCRSLWPTVFGPTGSYRETFKDSLLEKTHDHLKSSLKIAAEKYVMEKLYNDPRLKALQGDQDEGGAGLLLGADFTGKRVTQVPLQWTAISNFAFEVLDELPSEDHAGSPGQHYTPLDV